MTEFVLAVALSVACGILANLATDPCRRLFATGTNYLGTLLLKRPSRARFVQQLVRTIALARRFLSVLLPISGLLIGLLFTAAEWPKGTFTILPGLTGLYAGFIWGVVLRKSWPCFLVSLGLMACYLAYVELVYKEAEKHPLASVFIIFISGSIASLLVWGASKEAFDNL